MLLCYEKAECVRLKAAKAVGYLIKDIWNINFQWDNEIKNDILEMKKKNYQIRISLVYIAGICIQIKWLEDLFFALCIDKIINVRVACAIVSNRYDLIKYKLLLKEDQEIDVVQAINTKYKKDYRNKLMLSSVQNRIIGDSFENVYQDCSSDNEKNEDRIDRIIYRIEDMI